MELTISTPALLFSTVSLLMIAFTNRFLALASLIRDLHVKYKTEEEKENIIAQIIGLKRRLRIVRNIQIIAISSLLLSAVCMLLIFIEKELAAKWFFGGALMLQIVALTLSVREITLSMNALELELSDIAELISPVSLRKRRKNESHPDS
ncbi:DUF2721 domain-containing protein [Emticicia sp. BO119]|uniref:DUF2721 domain-containing protein n=1 Tax=Emticicia sp. BO119 TaxID=2757768 RepID=UPI0015F0F362|nr:DUF2721 domain-containing protein [Emticicia sp. BO119]MBA4852746.1 DUF2721 domain-containing protein [Emticicia sp. BO119]